mmetsp:Transcript_23033/g.50504  ORF Transcript_23033/g.50504 Transcript_23033/m.50504 type:complete len:422 (-) Transcript_23033:839-2104(-)
MDDALRLHTLLRVVLALELDHLPGGVLHHLQALYRVRPPQHHRLPRGQPVVVLRVLLPEVRLLDVDGAAEGDLVLGPDGGLRLEHLHLVAGVVDEGHLEGVGHQHRARRVLVQVLADEVLQQVHPHHVLVAGDADGGAEGVDGGGGRPPAPQPAEGEQAGVVPPVHVLVRHQRVQLALAQHRVRDVQPRVLPHVRQVRVQALQQPVVGGAAALKLERAEGVGDVLEGVHDAVRVVVAGVDAPLVARVGVGHVLDAVGDEVVHVEVGVLHVHLHPQRRLPLLPLPVAHLLEQPQRLLDRPVAPRAIGVGLAASDDLLLGLVVHVRLVLADQLHCKVVQLLEVVAAVRDLPRLPSHPLDDLLDVVDVLHALGGGVGVIVAQVAHPPVLLGKPKVHVHRLRVPDVQVPVRLWGEPRPHLPARGL